MHAVGMQGIDERQVEGIMNGKEENGLPHVSKPRPEDRRRARELRPSFSFFYVFVLIHTLTSEYSPR